MADNRPDDEYFDDASAEQDQTQITEDGLVYYVENADAESTSDYDVGEDGSRFYIDSFQQSNNPEDDDFDDNFDADYPQLPDDEFSDLDGLGGCESADDDEDCASDDDEFDDLNADENVYGGDDFA